MNNRDTGNNQQQSDNGREVRNLLVDCGSGHGHQYNPDACPYPVGDTDGNFAKSSAVTGSACAANDPASALIIPAAKMR